MRSTRRITVAAASVLAAAFMVAGATSAAAHGGSVSPPSEQQECRNIALHDKGEGSNGQDGVDTAGENDAAAEGGHCE